MSTNIGDLSLSITADTNQLTSGMSAAREQLRATTTVIVQQQNAWAELGAAAITASASIIDTAVDAALKVQEMRQEWTRFLISTGIGIAKFGATAGLAIAGLKTTLKSLTTTQEESTVASERAARVIGGELGRAIDNLSRSTSELSAAFAAPFAGAVTSVGQLAYEFLGIDVIVKAATETATSWINTLSAGLDTTTKAVYRYGDTITTALAITQSMFTMSADASAAFYEQAASLRQVAIETERVIAKQESQRDSFQFLRQVQLDAAAATERAAEVAKVQSLLTVEAVDAEVRALQQRSAQAILNGQTDDNWRKQTEALFVALEKQREGIKNGTIIDKEAEAARRAAAQQAEEAARKQQQLNDQGVDRIARLKDQIDILNGAATEAEVAMREMARAGFSQDQIQEVGRLTEELNRLKEEAKADGTDEKAMKTRKQREIDTGPAAVLKGTSSAFSAIFGAGRKTDDRTAKATETTVVELKKLNNNILKLNNGPQIVGGGAI